ncbi:MAG: hypothetical protein ABI882_15275 [Acidobacteriota bacterium]
MMCKSMAEGELPKVFVVRNQYPLVGLGESENVNIIALWKDFCDRDNIVAGLPQVFSGRHPRRFVNNELHLRY